MLPIELIATDSQQPVVHDLRVLFADDDPVNKAIGRYIFECLGYRADIVGDGVEALAALRRSSYDVVLMDLWMPMLDGYATARRIRSELPRKQQPRIIAMTASDALDERARCLAAGMDDFLSKPFCIEELDGLLRRVQRLRQAG